MPDDRVIILTGPTSVGKTAVAMELSDMMPVRIISADSMQVYRRMDIGTAKPTREEQQRVVHYGIDLVEPNHPYTVAEYKAAVTPALNEIREAGCLPLLVGGTRLYLQALCGSFDSGIPPNPMVRARLLEEARRYGPNHLHQQLASIDEEAYHRVHPNDTKRIVRALEVWETLGHTISDIQAESRHKAPLANALWIALVRDRDSIYNSVEIRTAAMIREGWMEEVDGLLRDGYGPYMAAIKAHGYRELAAHLQGEMSYLEAVDMLNKNIRHYVRYQLGWIRQMPQIISIEAVDPPKLIAERVAHLLTIRPAGGNQHS